MIIRSCLAITWTASFVLALAACSPPNASRAPTAATGRVARGIVGGAVDAGHPAVVALVTATSTSVAQQCSGTLIAPRSVLSAAHCLASSASGSITHVFFGEVLPRTVNGRFVPVARTVPHPRSTASGPETDPFDVAVLELAERISDITPVELYEHQVEVGQTIVHVGFGASSSVGGGLDGMTDGSGIKRVITTRVRLIGDQIEVGAPDRSTCDGDSGGPGLVIPPGRTDPLVAGVVAWGPEDCAGASWDSRVDLHALWIRETMNAWEEDQREPAAAAARCPGDQPASTSSGCSAASGRPELGLVILWLGGANLFAQLGGRVRARRDGRFPSTRPSRVR